MYYFYIGGIETWTDRNVNFVLKAHCHAYTVKSFAEVVTDSSLDSNVKTALTALCKLYAVHGIMENCGEFLQVVYISLYICNKHFLKYM